ncbi:MAG: acyl-CoA dehydrogenase family protein [Myxococcales bacterium]|nr:acyl-CoA dehydrogenase family protein [Myxococcales bacterium]
MDFSLTEEQESIVATATAFARDELAPGYRDRDAKGMLDRSLVRRMGELGLIGAELPEQFGGIGLDFVTAGLIMEAIARGDFNVAYVQLLGSLNAHILVNNMDPAIAAEWVPGICRGEHLIALALTEPDHGSDAAAIELLARPEGSHYVLTGEKTSISLADQADVAVVFARTGSVADRAHGISAFLVPMDARGITTTRFDDAGEHAIGRGSVFFDAVKVPARHLIAQEGKGFTQVMQGFDYSRALIGLQCLAVADESLRETWEYIQHRRAFGQPLAAFQGLTFPLAELETYVEAARQLCYKALWLKSVGKPHTKEAAMCKWWAPQVAFDTVHRCLLAHGHAGYSRELPFEQRLRDVLGLQIGDGTAEIMKRVIVRGHARPPKQ